MSFYGHGMFNQNAGIETASRTEAPDAGMSSLQDDSIQENSVAAHPQSLSRSVLTTLHFGGDGHSSPTKRRWLTPTQGSPSSTSPLGVQNSPAESSPLSSSANWTLKSADSIVGTFDIDTRFSNLEQTSTLTNPPSCSAVSDADLELTSLNIQAGFPMVPESPSKMYVETSMWPLPNLEEAELLRYYVENLARSFDMSDPYRHFRTVVPQRAATCPTLLNAIFALSARHLSRVGEYDPLISDRYHQKCLEHLIPVLNDPAAVLDENLLASTIILRHLEEIEVPLTGQLPSDQQNHLLGAHVFITAQESATTAGGLREAAFWVGLRQEIYMAFINQRSIMPVLKHCNIDRSFGIAADHVWACRIVVLCADVIRYCFGDSDHRLAGTYKVLNDLVTRWNDCKPASFTPMYIHGAETVFPKVWFLGDDVIIGWQNYHIAQILLIAHNPNLPRLGLKRASTFMATDEEIKGHVRMLCGICQSHPDVRPCAT